jgi:hypothetical protein
MSTSANRRNKRAEEKFKIKIHKEFIKRTKHMTDEQLKAYVDKQVAKYAYLDKVAVVEDGKGPAVEDLFDKKEQPQQYGS